MSPLRDVHSDDAQDAAQAKLERELVLGKLREHLARSDLLLQATWDSLNKGKENKLVGQTF